MANQKQDKPDVSSDSEKEAQTADNTDKNLSTKASKLEQKSVPEGQMLIKVYSPYREYFDDVANSISAVNDTGPFDVLPGHHRFLTLLDSCELDIRTQKGSDKIKVDRGIMFVQEDRVTVFLDV